MFKFYPTGLLKRTYGSRVYPVAYSYDYAGRLKTMTNWSGFGSAAGARVTGWNYNAQRGWLENKRYPDLSLRQDYNERIQRKKSQQHSRIMQSMTIMKCVTWIVACLCPISSGCREEARSHYSEAQVRAIVTPGTPRSDVEKVFGEPLVVIPTDNGPETAIYSFANNTGASFQRQFSGFQVRYRDGRVEKLLPVYSDQSVSEPSGNITGDPGTAKPRTNSPYGLLFFRVSEVEPRGGTYVDTAALPAVGYISKEPDLRIAQLRSVTAGEDVIDGSKRKAPTIIVQLTEVDAQSLRKFTETQIGKRVVVSVAGRLVAAPYVLAPIDQGRFSFRLTNQKERDEVMSSLETLLEKE